MAVTEATNLVDVRRVDQLGKRWSANARLDQVPRGQLRPSVPRCVFYVVGEVRARKQATGVGPNLPRANRLKLMFRRWPGWNEYRKSISSNFVQVPLSRFGKHF